MGTKLLIELQNLLGGRSTSKAGTRVEERARPRRDATSKVHRKDGALTGGIEGVLVSRVFLGHGRGGSLRISKDEGISDRRFRRNFSSLDRHRHTNINLMIETDGRALGL